MQRQISDAASVSFARGFYQILARSESLDDAVREGRRAIYTSGASSEWGTPTLYLNSDDGELFARADDSDLPRPEAIPDVQQRLNEGAGGYFEAQREYIIAAHHYERTNQTVRALKLLIANREELVNHGYAESLLQELQDMNRERLGMDLWLDATRTKGGILYHLGKSDMAVEVYQELIPLTQNRSKRADLFKALGDVFEVKGEISQALAYYEQLARLAAENNDYENLIESEIRVGWIYYHQSNFALAKEHYDKVIALGEQTANQRAIARGNGNLGLVFIELNDFASALAAEHKSLEIYRELGDKAIFHAFLDLVVILKTQGEYEQATKHLDEASVWANADRNAHNMLAVEYQLGDLCLLQGQTQDALRYFFQGLEMAQAQENLYMTAGICMGMAESYMDLGEAPATFKFANISLEKARSLEQREIEGRAVMCLAGAEVLTQNLTEINFTSGDCDAQCYIFAPDRFEYEWVYSGCAIGDRSCSTTNSGAYNFTSSGRPMYKGYCWDMHENSAMYDFAGVSRYMPYVCRSQ